MRPRPKNRVREQRRKSVANKYGKARRGRHAPFALRCQLAAERMRLQRVVTNSRGRSLPRSPAFPFTREHWGSRSSIQVINGEYTAEAVAYLRANAEVRLCENAINSLSQEIWSNGLPAEGLEPTRPCDHWILSPARLPIPPRRRCNTGVLPVSRASEPARAKFR